MQSLFDTHCHLYDRQLTPDIDQVLIQAQESEVHQMLVPGEHIESCSWISSLIEKHAKYSIFGAAGVHPHSASSFQKEQLSDFEGYLERPEFLAVGEIGLDYYRNLSDPDIQKEVFITFLDLALKHQKPVIIHNRESTKDMITLLTAWKKQTSPDSRNHQYPGVFHGFNGDPEILEFGLLNGFYFGLGGPVTFTNAIRLQEMVETIPIERIILETDSPYLSPHPKRGKRNEPANVRLVAEKIADLKNMLLEDVAAITTKNALELFGMERVK